MEALELSFELGQMLHGLRGAINAVETLERTHRTGEAEDPTTLAAEEAAAAAERELDAAWERVLDAGEDEPSALEDADAYEDESLRGARELLDKVAMEEEFVPEPEEEEEEFVPEEEEESAEASAHGTQGDALMARKARRGRTQVDLSSFDWAAAPASEPADEAWHGDDAEAVADTQEEVLAPPPSAEASPRMLAAAEPRSPRDIYVNAADLFDELAPSGELNFEALIDACRTDERVRELLGLPSDFNPERSSDAAFAAVLKHLDSSESRKGTVSRQRFLRHFDPTMAEHRREYAEQPPEDMPGFQKPRTYLRERRYDRDAVLAAAAEDTDGGRDGHSAPLSARTATPPPARAFVTTPTTSSGSRRAQSVPPKNRKAGGLSETAAASRSSTDTSLPLSTEKLCWAPAFVPCYLYHTKLGPTIRHSRQCEVGGKRDCVSGDRVMDDGAIHRWTYYVVSSRRENGGGMRFGVASSDTSDTRAWALRLKDSMITVHDAIEGTELSVLEKMTECALVDRATGATQTIHKARITCEVDLSKGQLSFGVNGGPMEAVAALRLPEAVVPWVILYHEHDTVTLCDYRTGWGLGGKPPSAPSERREDLHPESSLAGRQRTHMEERNAPRGLASPPKTPPPKKKLQTDFPLSDGRTPNTKIMPRMIKVVDDGRWPFPGGPEGLDCLNNLSFTTDEGIPKTKTGLRPTRPLPREEWPKNHPWPKSRRESETLLRKVQREAQIAELRAGNSIGLPCTVQVGPGQFGHSGVW